MVVLCCFQDIYTYIDMLLYAYIYQYDVFQFYSNHVCYIVSFVIVPFKVYYDVLFYSTSVYINLYGNVCFHHLYILKYTLYIRYTHCICPVYV